MMALNYRKILASNVRAMMESSDRYNSAAKLAKACHAPKRRIGASTILHLLNPEGPQPQLDTIIAIAEAFRLETWLLLTTDFDARERTGGRQPSPEVIELARKLEDTQPRLRALALELVHLEAHHTVHEPAAAYSAPGKPKRRN